MFHHTIEGGYDRIQNEEDGGSWETDLGFI